MIGRVMRAAALAMAMILAASAGGGGSAAAQGLVSFTTDLIELVTRDGRRTLVVEMAVSAKQLAQGLMYRPSLPADSGMLFDFGRAQPVSMWMKNTLIPLDMVFIDDTGRVIAIAERTIPMSTEIVSSPQPARAVLELNAGAAARLGLRPGDRVNHRLFDRR